MMKQGYLEVHRTFTCYALIMNIEFVLNTVGQGLMVLGWSDYQHRGL